jgi:1-acyl-sn-glycerol-3-phosphate acyltransferase
MKSFRFYFKTMLFMVLTVTLAPFCFFVLLVLYKLRQRIGPRLVQLYFRICLVIFGIRIQRTETHSAFHSRGKNVLIISNHASFLDIFILSSIFGCVFVSKTDVKYYPIIGQIAWLMGVIFFDRGSSKERIRVLKKIAKRTQAGAISVFPQGTTGRITDRLPFQRGIFKVVEMNPDITILPVTIRYKKDAEIAWHGESFLKNARKVFARKRIDVKLILHDTMTIKDYKGRTSAQVREILEEKITGELERGY